MRRNWRGSHGRYRILLLGVLVVALLPIGGLLVSSQHIANRAQSSTFTSVSPLQGAKVMPATLTGDDATITPPPPPTQAPPPPPGAPAPTQAPPPPPSTGTVTASGGGSSVSSGSSASLTSSNSSSNSSVSNNTDSVNSVNSWVPSGMHLVFDANFNGSSLNTAVWGTCYPWASPDGCTNFGNSQEEEWYLPSQDQVYGGVLHLVAEEQATEGTTKSGSPKTYAYRSGMVTTYPSFSFTYGYVQVVAKLPGGNGTWPALWLLPTNESWPPEIDMMENWGNPYDMYSTYHWLSASGPQQSMTKVNSSSNLAQSWNTYAVDWEPSSITWYLNGKVVASYTGSQISNMPMYFLANLAIYGSAPSSSSFDIKSVSIYQR